MALHMRCLKCGFLEAVPLENGKSWLCPNCQNLRCALEADLIYKDPHTGEVVELYNPFDLRRYDDKK
jgi:hypothetical protein